MRTINNIINIINNSSIILPIICSIIASIIISLMDKLVNIHYKSNIINKTNNLDLYLNTLFYNLESNMYDLAIHNAEVSINLIEEIYIELRCINISKYKKKWIITCISAIKTELITFITQYVGGKGEQEKLYRIDEYLNNFCKDVYMEAPSMNKSDRTRFITLLIKNIIIDKNIGIAFHNSLKNYFNNKLDAEKTIKEMFRDEASMDNRKYSNIIIQGKFNEKEYNKYSDKAYKQYIKHIES